MVRISCWKGDRDLGGHSLVCPCVFLPARRTDNLLRDKIKHNKVNDGEFRGLDTAREALLYMIEKAPFNRPSKNAATVSHK